MKQNEPIPILRKPRLFSLLVVITALLLLAGVAYAQIVTIVDDGGPDDYPGQKDLNQLTIDEDGLPASLALTWNWDDTAWSGNNTGDACSLFDTDGDGLANYALCVTVGGTPATYQSTRLYSCGDNNSDRCSQPNALISPFDSSCEAGVVANTDPFGVPSSPYYALSHVTGNTCSARPGCYTDDTVASCDVRLADFGNANDAQLLNVCTYPSQEPNSAPSECIVNPNNGFLSIYKVADPNDDTAFVFTLNPAAQNGQSQWTINGTGSVQLISVAPGSYALTEAVPPGWLLTNASCTIGTTPTGTPTNTGLSAITVQTGLETVCTFTDKKAAIDIEKATNGQDADTPTGPYIVAGSPVNWTYVVTNTGYVPLTNVSVSDNMGVTVTCPQTTLAVGESMTCTASGIAISTGQYSNTGTATGTATGINNTTATVSDSDPSHYFGVAAAISIVKTTSASATGPWSNGPSIPMGDPVYWQYVVKNETNGVPLTGVTITDDQIGSLNAPMAAPYTVVCTRNDSPTPTTVTLPTTLQGNGQAGDTVTCVVSGGTAIAGRYDNLGTTTGAAQDAEVTANDTSWYTGTYGTLTVLKVTNPPNAGHLFEFELGEANNKVLPPHTDLAENPFYRSAQQSALQIKVKPGTYSLTELGDYINDPGDWQLTNVQCLLGTQSVGVWDGYDPARDTSIENIPVGAGETVNCTFTNEVGPNAVTLAGFTADASGTSVTLTWETVSELDNLGFNVYRATGDLTGFSETCQVCEWTKVNAALIPAATPGSGQGAVYTWTDLTAAPGATYWYALEDVALDGATTRHAPVSVTLEAPNALGLDGLGAGAAATPLAPLAAIGLALLSGFVFARRQRR